MIFDSAAVVRDGVSWISLDETAAGGNAVFARPVAARIPIIRQGRRHRYADG
jgi:hypothetical protein